MKVGCVICGPDVAYGPLALLSGTFEEKVQKAAALGYDGIELMVRDPAGLDWPYVRRTLAEAGLQTPQVVTGELFGADGLRLVTPDGDLYRRAVARTQAVIDLAGYLGAMVNIGRLRGRLEGLDAANPWAEAVERLGSLAAYAAARGVRLSLEPLNRYETDFILDVADGMRMVRDLQCDNVGLMLDVFHMNIEEASIARSLEAAGDRCWHVHIADSNRHYPGAGHLDFDAVFATLARMGYGGYVSAELFPLPDPDTAARETIAFVRKKLNGTG
jgi:sugar phosphate isomerase/epimerase